MEQISRNQSLIRKSFEKPQNCLVVEDAAAGIDAACAGGFLSAGIGDAAAHEGVTYPIRTFGELLSICQDC